MPANVRSPLLLAISKRTPQGSRPVRTCLVHGMTRAPKTHRSWPGSASARAVRPGRSRAGQIDSRPRSRRSAAQRHGQAIHRRSTTVAVAVLEAEIDRPADDQARKILVGEQGGCHELGQNDRASRASRIAHQGQIDELLDRAAPELRPDPRVFAARFLVGRMRRPVDAEMPRGSRDRRRRRGCSDRASM